MPFTPPVQSVLAQDQTGNLTSIPATLPNPTVAGNTLVVCGAVGFLSGGAPGVTLSVTDNQGNVYLGARGPDISDYNGTHSQQQVFQTWYFPNLPGGTVTVTLHTAGTTTTDIMLIVLEYTGQFTFDQGAFGFRSQSGSRGIGTGNVFTSATALDTGLTGATGHASELLVAFGADLTGDQATYTAGTGYTREIAFSAGGSSGFAMDGSVSSTGTQEAKATSSANIEWGIQLSTFFAPPPPVDHAHSADVLITSPGRSAHSADIYISALQSRSHGADVYINPVEKESFVDLGSNLIVPIVDPNAFVKLAPFLLNQVLQWVQLAAVLINQTRSFVQLAPVLAQSGLSFVQLGGVLQKGDPSPSHSADVSIAPGFRAFVNLGGTLIQGTTPTDCGFFPSINYVKLGGWLINNPGTPSGLTSVQLPNTSPFTLADDWHSDQDALAAYRPISVFKLAGFPLVVTGFTVGVMSYQTRTKQWLRRVDADAGGVVLSTRTTKAVQANGRIITTSVVTQQVQDITIVTTTVADSGVPNRITTTVRETSKSGQVTTREAVTTTINGIRNTLETKVVSSIPPQTDNIQPIKVTTLDGIQHFQFFDQVNQEWFGGEQEGTTQTSRKESTAPATLAGQTTDKFGNKIIAHTVDELVQNPNGSTILTHDVTIGIDPNIGTVTTDTQETFNGIQTDTKKFTNYPDGTQQVQETVVNAITGDSFETDTQIQTDEFGQVTTTITTIETKTFPDPVTGIVRTQETRTVTVTVGPVTTTSSVTTTDNNFEDDIVNDKIKVFLVQEFTISALVDDQVLTALSEINIRHQTKYALLELFSQMLGNAQLSWPFRQNLINQYNEAQNCLDPVQFQALGKTYNVVFAPSASAFRDKYVTGTEPHAHELQMILQQRSDLITGTRGFL